MNAALLTLVQNDTAEASTRLTAGGWILMLLSVGFVTTLCFRCFRKVLTLPAEEKETVKDLHSA